MGLNSPASESRDATGTTTRHAGKGIAWPAATRRDRQGCIVPIIAVLAQVGVIFRPRCAGIRTGGCTGSPKLPLPEFPILRYDPRPVPLRCRAAACLNHG